MFSHAKHLILVILAAAVGTAVLPAAAAAQRVTELVSVGGNGAFQVTDLRASDDGSRAVFVTAEPLDPADTDTKRDIYQRAGGQTTLVSAGGSGAYDPVVAQVAPDGGRVLFATADALVAADTDVQVDVYEWSGGQAQLVSVATGGHNAYPAGVSADWSHIYFGTAEALVAADSDSKSDVYVRSAGQTSLVSAGGNGTADVQFVGASADGSRAFIATEDKLTGGDLDIHQDIYERAGGQTTLLSIGNRAHRTDFAAASADGSRVFIWTAEALLATDTDTQIDVYERSAGQTTLLSPGGSGTGHVYPVGASEDGTRVFFHTTERLTASDTDTSTDVYERSGGQTTLVSAGGNGPYPAVLAGITPDGSHAFFRTADRLLPEDTDAKQDIYEHSGGQVTLVSAGGNGDHDADFGGSSTDGARVFFTTTEQLAGADTDTQSDLYERSGGQTELVSVGGPSPVAYADVSTAGSAVFFHTQDALAPSDLDSSSDVYVARVPEPAPGAGPGAGEGPVPGADQAAPVLTQASLTRRRFAARRATRGRAPAGTAFRFTLSEPASVRISIARSRAGRRAQGRCVAPRRSNQRRPRCARLVTVGALTVRATRGSNQVAFAGQVRGRPLTPGRYVATLTATDAAGNRSRPVTVRFTVIQRVTRSAGS